MKTTVKSHSRSVKGKRNTVVRRHARHCKKSKAPVTVTSKYEPGTDSYAHTDTVVDKNNKVVRHSIKLDHSKIKRDGEDPKNLLEHEKAHVKDREIIKLKKPTDSFSKSGKAKKLRSLLKNSEACKKLKGDKYAQDTEELFARAVAQHKTGTKPKHIKSGMGWSKKDFAPIKKELTRLKL